MSEPTYRVEFMGVGAYVYGEIITKEQAGPQVERLLHIGAIKPVNDLPLLDDAGNAFRGGVEAQQQSQSRARAPRRD